MTANPTPPMRIRSRFSFKRPTPGRLVKDAPTRLAHWLIACCFVIAYITAESEQLRLLHVTMGYTMLGLLVCRVVYGVVGPRHASLMSLWRKATGLPRWARQTWRQLADVTHPTPINWTQGRLMVTPVVTLLILGLVLPIALSGYLTFNEFGGDWGEEIFGELHEWFGNALLASVLTHIGLLVVFSLMTRNNEAAPMWHGAVPGQGPDVVKSNRLWLAVLMLIGVGCYIAWEWQQSPRGLITW